MTPEPGERLLVYLAFHGFSQDIIQWSEANSDIPIDCFYDKPNCPPVETHSKSLKFHKLDGQKFLTLMAKCRAVACTAGFEGVSEAAYLGKPALLVPVENHVEQLTNAKEAEQAGLGIHDRGFALTRLLRERPAAEKNDFKQWVDRGERILLAAVDEAAARSRAHWEHEAEDVLARALP